MKKKENTIAEKKKNRGKINCLWETKKNKEKQILDILRPHFRTSAKFYKDYEVIKNAAFL